MPGGTKAPKLWPAEPCKWKWTVSSGRPSGPKPPRQLAAQNRARHPVGVSDRQRVVDLFAPLQSRFGQFEQGSVVERFVQAVFWSI